MKIRNDFVTNSSSVSYIITMDLDIAERYNELEQAGPQSKKKLIFDAVKEDVMKEGSRNEVDGQPTFVKKYSIRPKTQASFDETYENQDIDFAAMSEEELWKYIKGEYILKNRLVKEYQGFSSMRFPKQCPDIRSSIVFFSPCQVNMVKKRLYPKFSEKDKRIFEWLRNEIEQEGVLWELDGKKVYARVYTYDIRKDCKYDQTIEKENFSSISDAEMKAYVMGEYFHNNKLQKHLSCFSCLAVGEKKK